MRLPRTGDAISSKRVKAEFVKAYGEDTWDTLKTKEVRAKVRHRNGHSVVVCVMHVGNAYMDGRCKCLRMQGSGNIAVLSEVTLMFRK